MRYPLRYDKPKSRGFDSRLGHRDFSLTSSGRTRGLWSTQPLNTQVTGVSPKAGV